MDKLSVRITKEQSGKTVKSILSGTMGLSRKLIVRAKRSEQGIMLNGVRVFTNAAVCEGDELCIEISDKKCEEHFEAMPYKLDILFEDDYLLIINKPAGMSVYGAKSGQTECTLVNAVAFYLGEEASIHLVSRLDRGTSGIILLAKSGYVHNLFRKIQHTGNFQREYLAVSCGTPKEQSGIITLPIKRAKGIKRETGEGGVDAETFYEVLKAKDGYSLIRLVPKTGRTHQLRVHMAAIGCPLAGDFLYGSESDKISRTALHSYSLQFCHPVTGEMKNIVCPLPEDMQALIAD